MDTQLSTAINLTGIHCAACQKVIERKLSRIDGVTQVIVDLSGKVIIIANHSISKDEARKYLEGTDYLVN